MPKYIVDRVERTLRNVEKELAWHIFCADCDTQEREDNILGAPVEVYGMDYKELEQEIEMLGGTLIARLL